MRKLSAVAAVSLATAGAVAAPAAAQVAERDPSAESPSGHVYELPVDSARDDAAPKRPPAGVAGGEAPAAAAPADGEPPAGGAPPASEEDAPPARPAGRAPSAIRSENGFGTSTRVPGVDRPAGAPRPATVRPSDPSGVRVFGLLALGVLLAIGVGLASRSRRRAP